ncbi:MAG: S-layer homology domain-containing protein [Oscillospiraceae bacterium]
MKHLWKRMVSALLICLCVLTVSPVAQAQERRFSDVPASHWAAEDIAASVDAGLFLGRKNGKFGLGQKMTRAAFATTLTRLFGWKTVSPAVGSFADNQDRDKWYYAAVETAYANGAATHQSENFRPNDAITREEMAVMLVRALNYETLAGLALSLPLPFTDVTTGGGYLSVAYALGIMGGVSATRFAPSRPATREQAAVALMRVYRQLNAPLTSLCGIDGVGGETAAHAMTAVAVPAARLTVSGKLQNLMEPAKSAALHDKWKAAGTKTLLGIDGTAAVLAGSPDVAAIAQGVEAGDWDGVQLDITGVTAREKTKLTDLATALRAALGKKTLYLVAEAPLWQGGGGTGYDYAPLAKTADRLILRIAPYDQSPDGFPTAPPDPFEEVYYALSRVGQLVPREKLSLLLTTTGTLWTGSGDTVRRGGKLSAAQLHSLLQSGESHYAGRYQAAYLTANVDGARQVAWYLDETAVRARVVLASGLGVHSLCLSDLSSVADYGDYSIVQPIFGS